jgi:hypothetical protein
MLSPGTVLFGIPTLSHPNRQPKRPDSNISYEKSQRRAANVKIHSAGGFRCQFIGDPAAIYCSAAIRHSTQLGIRQIIT